MKTEIRERVLQLNPWFENARLFDDETARQIPNPFVPRAINLKRFEDPRKAKFIIGPRQAGKSTLVWSYLSNLEPHCVMFLNGEEELVRSWCGSAIGLVRDLQKNFPSVKTLFFDEAQRIENVGLLIKGLVDAKVGLNIFVTGSSSYHLMDRVRESLAGRAERRTLLPFSIDELSSNQGTSIPAVSRSRKREIEMRMAVIGGYPDVWFTDDPAHELSTLAEAFVLRDASDRFKLKRPDAMRGLLQLLARSTGSMINYSEFAGHLGVSVNTVRDYVSILEETWIVKMVPAFAGGKRREITKTPRIHFYDVGLRNSLIRSFDPNIHQRIDRGAITETLVFSELCKTLSPSWAIHFWRAKGGAEVDFVLVSGSRLIAVEVKTATQQKLTKSSRSFLDSYKPEQFILVTLDEQDMKETREKSTIVKSMWLGDLSTQLSSLEG